jgi:spore photoproduct lyase
MIKYQTTKTLVTKPNNNSANAIAPNLIYGCFGGCVNTYCYMSRHNGKRIFVNTNVMEIVSSVFEWAKHYEKVPDQQDPIYKMVDVACNTDLVLMQKHCPIPLADYLKMYDDHPEINTTMATKYPSLLKLDVNHFNKKPRVRVSLMPQSYSEVLEPKMEGIESRIHDINRLKNLGWEVHINYSPVIIYKEFRTEYRNLFSQVKNIAGINKCEVIFLTNHPNQMERVNGLASEMMFKSNQVKNKMGVMRYPLDYKAKAIQVFKSEYTEFFDLDTIRYIF